MVEKIEGENKLTKIRLHKAILWVYQQKQQNNEKWLKSIKQDARDIKTLTDLMDEATILDTVSETIWEKYTSF